MTYDKKLKCGVFIDYSNVLWGSLEIPLKDRWFVDFDKFKAYLKDKYRPQFYKFYAADDTSPKSEKFRVRAEMQRKMFKKLEGNGYDVVTKPLKYIRNENGCYSTKGDMDIEVSMDIIGALNDLDTVILVSGDSDYLPLVKSVHSQGKHIRIISFDKLLSWELRTFSISNLRCNYKLLDDLKDEVKLIK